MKTKKCGEEFISCLGSNYKQPIADLVDHLLAVPLPDFPNDPPSNPEVDYAISIIVLLVLAFEAWISRARNFDERTDANVKDKKYVLSWMKSLNDPKLQPLIDQLSEVYFLRDSIIHNHIWTYTQKWDQDRAHYSDFDLDLTWQSDKKKIDKFINGERPLPSFPRTKILNLIVVPNFIGRREVAAVFKTVKDALTSLDELGYIKVVPKIPHVRFAGKLSFPFWSLIDMV
jgi:hypothetical protein